MQRALAFFRSLLGLKQDGAKPDTIEANTFANEFAVIGKRIINTGPYKVELDLTSQVLAISAPIDQEFDFRKGSIGGGEAQKHRRPHGWSQVGHNEKRQTRESAVSHCK